MCVRACVRACVCTCVYVCVCVCACVCCLISVAMLLLLRNVCGELGNKILKKGNN